jgi:hypothetical protein
VKNQIIGLIEKAVTTYIEAFVALLAASTALDISIVQSAAIAAIPAAFTVIANGIPQPPTGMSFYGDLVFRTVRTYVVSFVGLLVAAPVFEFSLGAFQAAAIGAIPAALAVVKGVLAGHIGNRETPALLPFKYDDFGLLTVNNNNWQDWQKFAIDPQPTVEVEVDGGLDEG